MSVVIGACCLDERNMQASVINASELEVYVT